VDFFQTTGVALPWGIASCLVRSNEKALSISGDSGFMLSVMGLETAV
jgi:acetolactate synthase I/II/III large subunit